MTDDQVTDDETTAANIGEGVARARYRRGWTQERLANESGLALATIKSHERGARRPRMQTLNRIARALGTTTSNLLAPATGVHIVDENAHEPDSLLAIRRALTPPVGVDAEPATPPDPQTWNNTLMYAERLYDEDKYDQVLDAVPVLIDEARALAPTHPEALAHAYLYTGRTLTQVRQLDLANHAFAEAMRIAHEVSDDVLAAWVVANQSWTLLLQGRFDEVERSTTTTADAIEPTMSADDTVRSATWGWLMIKASAAAIRDARTDEANEYMRMARTAAAGMGELDRTRWYPTGVTGFCPALVRYKEVENAALLGDNGTALTIAEQIEPQNTTTPASDRQRHSLDVASVNLAEHRTEDAIERLLNVREVAPEWLRHQGYARGLISQLVETRRRAFTDEVGTLADHVGITL